MSVGATQGSFNDAIELYLFPNGIMLQKQICEGFFEGLQNHHKILRTLTSSLSSQLLSLFLVNFVGRYVIIAT